MSKKITELTCRKCGFTSKPVDGRFDGWSDIGVGEMKGLIKGEKHIHICPRCSMEMQHMLDMWRTRW